MGLFNMFKPAEGETPNTPEGGDAPKVDSEGNAITPPPEGLDKWGNLVQTKDSKTASENTSEVFDPVAILKDPEALEKISDTLDFTTAISAETQQKLADNSSDAIISLVNDVGKAAYLQAIQHSSALSQQHVADRFAQQQPQIKGDILSSITDYELEQALPEIKNPIIQLGIKGFIDKVKEQNPSISGRGIAEEVKGYLKEMHGALNPETKSSRDSNKGKEVDWLSEMGF